MRGERSPDAAPGCAPASRGSGRLRDCPPRSSPVGPGRFVQPRRTSSASRTGRAEQPPGAPSALSPSSSAPLPGLRQWSAGRGASAAALLLSLQGVGGLRPPGRRRCPTREARLRTSPGLFVWGWPGAPNHLHLARRRRSGENPERRRTGRRAKESGPPGFVCPGRLPRTRIAYGSGSESPRLPPSRPGGRGPRGGEQLRRRGGSRCGRAWGARRCGPERGSPHRREQEQPGAEQPVRPSERACVRGRRAHSASRFCLASQLNFPRRD